MINFTKKFAEQIQKSVELVEEFKSIKVQATGALGEFVFSEIARQFLSSDYKIITDVVLKFNNGTTQIDLIIVSRYGIFVVEIKAYKGWIFGTKYDKKWTQVLYNMKNSFQNPLNQNNYHISALKALLNYYNEVFKSLIVFSGEVKFKTNVPDNVVRGSEHFLNYISNYRTVLLSDDDVNKIVKLINDSRLHSNEHKFKPKK